MKASDNKAVNDNENYIVPGVKLIDPFSSNRSETFRPGAIH